jgi:hypothetical protein
VGAEHFFLKLNNANFELEAFVEIDCHIMLDVARVPAVMWLEFRAAESPDN